MTRKIEKTLKKINNYDENNDKMLQKTQNLKKTKNHDYEKHFFMFVKFEFGPSTIVC